MNFVKNGRSGHLERSRRLRRREVDERTRRKGLSSTDGALARLAEPSSDALFVKTEKTSIGQSNRSSRSAAERVDAEGAHASSHVETVRQYDGKVVHSES